MTLELTNFDDVSDSQKNRRELPIFIRLSLRLLPNRVLDVGCFWVSFEWANHDFKKIVIWFTQTHSFWEGCDLESEIISSHSTQN